MPELAAGKGARGFLAGYRQYNWGYSLAVEDIKEKFSSYNLNNEDEIKSKYYVDEYERPIIIEMEKYSN